MIDILVTTARYVSAGGGEFLIQAILLFFIYTTVRYLIIKRFRPQENEFPVSKHEKTFRASLFLVGILMTALFIIGIIVNWINHTPAPNAVVRNSYALLETDRALFGVYPEIWFHQNSNPLKHYFDGASRLIIDSYAQLGFLVSLLFVATLAFNPSLLIRVILSFLISFFASLPFWFMYPAVTPNETFYSNKIGAVIPENVAQEMKTFTPNRHVTWILEYVAEHRETGKNGYYGITTIPSMHITWSVFVLYYGIMLYPILAFYLIPYFLLNALSTVYLLQHFTLDVVAGIAMGMTVIALVSRIKFVIPNAVVLASQSFRSDINAVIALFTKSLARLRIIVKRDSNKSTRE